MIPMQQELYDELQQHLQVHGPEAALDHLCAALRERKDYGNLFYALLLKKRHALRVPPLPIGSSQDLPATVHAAFEDAIRDACRTVGQLFLEADDIPRAWTYFRMLGETEPIARAIDNLTLVEGEDCQQVIEIAYHQGVNPRKGFDLILKRYGICSAITTLGQGQESPFGPEVREHCIKRLVRALHSELRERLVAEITQVEGKAPEAKTIPEMLTGRESLFEGDFCYHIDVSHLSSVVQMSAQLSPGPELELARELCAYGQHLSPRFQYPTDPPFEDQYRDYGIYLGVLAGHDVEAGLAHFRAKAAQADPETVGTFPAEVLVNLLLRVGRGREAIAVARQYLTGAEQQRPLTCPSLLELCERVKDYEGVVGTARAQNSPVHFLAGLLAAQRATIA
jgi:hypothetical protein